MQYQKNNQNTKKIWIMSILIVSTVAILTMTLSDGVNIVNAQIGGGSCPDGPDGSCFYCPYGYYYSSYWHRCIHY